MSAVRKLTLLYSLLSTQSGTLAPRVVPPLFPVSFPSLAKPGGVQPIVCGSHVSQDISPNIVSDDKIVLPRHI